MRALREYFCPSLLGRKAMASLLAASRKNSPAASGLHARTKPVRLGAASLARLICALWQNNPPSIVQIRCAYRGYLTVAVRLRRKTHTGRVSGQLRIIKCTCPSPEGSRMLRSLQLLLRGDVWGMNVDYFPSVYLSLDTTVRRFTVRRRYPRPKSGFIPGKIKSVGNTP